MDQKVKAIHEASATAEKDEAIYNLLKETQLSIVNGIQKLKDKQSNLSYSLDSSVCRLKKNESLVTIHENKNLLPQIVVDDDSNPSRKKEEEKKPGKVPSLADYVFDSVRCGLSVVDKKQICVDIRSDVDDTVYKVFEDVNPYLARDLPPLIGSDEFYTGDYAKPKRPTSNEHIDDVIVQIPRTHVQITPQKSDAAKNHIPAEIPKSIPPSLMDSTMNDVTPVLRDQRSSTVTVDKESLKNEEFVEELEPEDKKSTEDSTLPEDSPQIEKTGNEQKKNQVNPPPNLAEIIKRGPAHIQKKNQPVSLFSDDDEIDEDANPLEVSQNYISKPNVVTIAQPPKAIPPPRTTATDEDKFTMPRAPPRTMPKTKHENEKGPTVVGQVKENPSESESKKETKPAPMARRTVPKPPSTTVKNLKTKSLFSSSDESEPEVNITVSKTTTGPRRGPVEGPKVEDTVGTSRVENTVEVPGIGSTVGTPRIGSTVEVPKTKDTVESTKTEGTVGTSRVESTVEVPKIGSTVGTSGTKDTVGPSKVQNVAKETTVTLEQRNTKENTKKSLFDDDSDSSVTVKVNSETREIPPVKSSGIRRPIFDDSSDDEFFANLKTQKLPEKSAIASGPFFQV